MNGKILRVLPDKGFGFIKGDDGVEYFFHRQDVPDKADFDSFVMDTERGQTVRVVFESVPSPKGPRAGDVIRDLQGY
jgi:cold shock CspA family protein